ncbi:hypothetical protein LCGC14_2013780 [marine sediment metagenome]|uniref:Uncharacterized protein n=1 Tax=marine sediment metagenome TaxID=412755 RepID=A0A0F9EZI9_9ZZZZ
MIRFYQNGTEFFPFGPEPFGELLLELDGSSSYVSSQSPETQLHIRSRVGEATQRALGGPEIPHSDAGVPIVPAGELSFTRQERELSEAPSTWLPALLRTLVVTAKKKEVFNEGGLLRFVKTVLELDGDTPIDIQSVLR